MKHYLKLALPCLMLAACGGANPPATERSAVQGGRPAVVQGGVGQTAADYTNVLQKIYVGYFGRPADPAGLAFFANNYLAAGAPTDIVGVGQAYATNPGVRAQIDSFGSSQESRDLYPGDNTEFLTAIYRNLFNRAPDPEGLAFWVAGLNSGGVTRAGAALALMAGTQSTDTVIINNKAAAATAFTAALNTPTLLAAYSGLEANAIVRSALSGVSQHTDIGAFQSTINATLVTLTGQQPVVSTLSFSGLALASPGGVSVDGKSNIFVANTGNHTVQQISSAGVVARAGQVGVAGAMDGATSVATFNGPRGTAADSAGNLYVADSGNNKVRKINAAGITSTLAGTGAAGSTNGPGAGASFNTPTGVALDGAGNVYVTDLLRVRKITPAGVVSTLAGTGQVGAANGAGTVASFNTLGGVAVDGANNVYVADSGNHLIRKITPAGLVSTLAGSGKPGALDGPGLGASFNAPTGLAIDAAGNLLVADLGNQQIRKVSPAGMVTTLAGTGQLGAADGAGNIASFNLPHGIALDRKGNLLVTEQGGNRLRSIAPAVAVAPAPSAEGAYSGTLSGGSNSVFQMLVLENGDYWSLYGLPAANGALKINGFVQGTGVSLNGVFSTANLKDFGFAPAIEASANITYNAAAGSIAGQVSSLFSGNIKFNGGPVTSAYNYAARPSASVLTGSWKLAINTGDQLTLTFGQGGAYSAVTGGGCRVSGSISPRLSGKNLYDFTIVFGPAPCDQEGLSGFGIAVPLTLSNGQTQLSLFGVDSTRQLGFWAVGVR